MPNLIIERQGAVLALTLDNPPMNQLHSSMLFKLDAAVREAQEDPEVRVIVLTGNGQRAFSAGADIKEFPEIYAQGKLEDTLAQRHGLLDALETSKKPIIAALNGLTLGGGLEVAMSCHFRLASELAVLGLPEIDLGIIPGWAGTQRMTRLCGSAKALEIMLLGQRLTSFTAMKVGLVHRVFGVPEFHNQVHEFAKALTEKAPLAVAGILQAVAAHEREGFDAGGKTEREWSTRISTTVDAVEGVAAFIQKRKPNFKGK